MSDLITSYYRFAQPGELKGRVADIRPGSEPNSVAVVVERGHATQELLDALGGAQAPMFATGQWYRLPDTPENRTHPRRILRASWELDPGGKLPEGLLCLSLERPNEHQWLVHENHASFLLTADMTWLLTRMVRSEVWIQRGAGELGDR
ncbi:hypothetical protein [Streptomyces sp. CC228A]|uniref:hypothetical protein n=1 Tax=Streptomyces sp. CC228A TaxID=2898186 RepID=UPI001F200BDB|nr:hypothetical protein [Streptomyces sp. CC228A]